MTASEYILFLLTSFAMGFIASIPVGAVQLELVRRSINGFLLSSVFIVVGSMTADIIYGFIAIFGLSQFLLRKEVLAVFWLITFVILTIIGFWVIKSSRRVLPPETEYKGSMQKETISIITGLTLSASNPLMITWWLLGVQLLKSLGFPESFTLADNISFIIAGALGIGGYLILLALITYKVKKFISVKGIQRITYILGLVLLGLAAYFLIRGALFFIKSWWH